jgi:hypothetical protein
VDHRRDGEHHAGWVEAALGQDMVDEIRMESSVATLEWVNVNEAEEIALAQRFDKLIAAEEFQSWELTVNANRTATLTCENGDGGGVFIKAIEYTDFPLGEITMYFINKTILLPSEY